MNWEICKNCGECCGIIPFDRSLFVKVQHLARKPYKVVDNGADLIADTDDGYCVFLDQNKKCAIYKDRPVICRLYGTIPELKCTHLRGERTDLIKEIVRIPAAQAQHGELL